MQVLNCSVAARTHLMRVTLQPRRWQVMLHLDGWRLALQLDVQPVLWDRAVLGLRGFHRSLTKNAFYSVTAAQSL